MKFFELTRPQTTTGDLSIDLNKDPVATGEQKLNLVGKRVHEFLKKDQPGFLTVKVNNLQELSTSTLIGIGKTDGLTEFHPDIHGQTKQDLQKTFVIQTLGFLDNQNRPAQVVDQTTKIKRDIVASDLWENWGVLPGIQYIKKYLEYIKKNPGTVGNIFFLPVSEVQTDIIQFIKQEFGGLPLRVFMVIVASGTGGSGEAANTSN